jgi:hypothetical protein
MNRTLRSDEPLVAELQRLLRDDSGDALVEGGVAKAADELTTAHGEEER